MAFNRFYCVFVRAGGGPGGSSGGCLFVPLCYCADLCIVRLCFLGAAGPAGSTRPGCANRIVLVCF